MDALEFLRAMAVDDKSVYLDQTDERYAPLFGDGRIAMIINGPWSLLELKEKKTDYGVAFLPAPTATTRRSRGRTCGRCSTTATPTGPTGRSS
ncbi:extracellular solute-binding protein [Nonomuraea rubra]|uniref:extracellular solute-binding protein n=1 Tax=Nonomuraea rubra TaxID=46180 RepID=UPI003CD062C5